MLLLLTFGLLGLFAMALFFPFAARQTFGLEPTPWDDALASVIKSFR